MFVQGWASASCGLWIAPIIGAALAGVAYRWLIGDKQRLTTAAAADTGATRCRWMACRLTEAFRKFGSREPRPLHLQSLGFYGLEPDRCCGVVARV
jgi:hypothetical protein